jgi:hypothetical protein
MPLFAALQNPFVWFALLIGAWAAWAIVRRAASGGKLPLRGRRGSAAAFANAGLAVQALYNPGAKQILEARQEEESQREDNDEGDGLAPRALYFVVPFRRLGRRGGRARGQPH